MSAQPRPTPSNSTTAGDIVPVLTKAHVEAVAELASEIWYEHYVPIIGRAQVDYMVPRFQSAAAIGEQIAQGFQYCLLDDRMRYVGYFAFRFEPEHAVFVSKLYVLAAHRGRGWARRALGHIEEMARPTGVGRIWLTVNKYNPAVLAYEGLGFVRVRPIVTDIGGGYVMDDYLMEKQLAVRVEQ